MVLSSSFFSVPARFSGRVVCRVNARGQVWAWRAPRAGQRPGPACLFWPAGSAAQAKLWASAAARAGLVATVRPGSACACWSSGPLAAAAPPFAVKVELNPGQTAAAAKVAVKTAIRAARAA